MLATRQAWVRLRAFKLWVEIRGCGGTASSSNFNCKYSVRESAKQLQRMCENVHRLIATSKPALQVPPAEEPVPKNDICRLHMGELVEEEEAATLVKLLAEQDVDMETMD